jgi:hypothetical protein
MVDRGGRATGWAAHSDVGPDPGGAPVGPHLQRLDVRAQLLVGNALLAVQSHLLCCATRAGDAAVSETASSAPVYARRGHGFGSSSFRARLALAWTAEIAERRLGFVETSGSRECVGDVSSGCPRYLALMRSWSRRRSLRMFWIPRSEGSLSPAGNDYTRGRSGALMPPHNTDLSSSSARWSTPSRRSVSSG